MKNLNIKINAMKKITFVFTLLACLSVLSSCSRGYGCPYTSTELKPLNTVESSSAKSYALIDDDQNCETTEYTIAD